MAVIKLSASKKAAAQTEQAKLIALVMASSMKIGGQGDGLTVSKLVQFLEALGKAEIVEKINAVTYDGKPAQTISQLPADLVTSIITLLNKSKIVAKLVKIPSEVSTRNAYVVADSARTGAPEQFVKWDFLCEVGTEKTEIKLNINLQDKETNTLWLNNLSVDTEVTLEFRTAIIDEKPAAWVRI